MGEEALKLDEVIVELKRLEKEEIREVIDFIGYLKARKKKKLLQEERDDSDDLLSVCGIVEGPPDLADEHDHYLYGWEKKEH
jgi:hypothetical protein